MRPPVYKQISIGSGWKVANRSPAVMFLRPGDSRMYSRHYQAAAAYRRAFPKARGRRHRAPRPLSHADRPPNVLFNNYRLQKRTGWQREIWRFLFNKRGGGPWARGPAQDT